MPSKYRGGVGVKTLDPQRGRVLNCQFSSFVACSRAVAGEPKGDVGAKTTLDTQMVISNNCFWATRDVVEFVN